MLARTELPDRADVVQPALWAVMVSLAAAWQAAGVTPDAVVGHSQGEIAAATVAGILSLDDAATVVALRSQALAALSGRGGMVSVAEPAEAVRDRIARWDGRLSVAAVNGPAATVVSGDPAALAELAAACEAAGVRARRLPVDYASHGAQVDQLRDDILAALAGITPVPARIPMISAMTGQWLAGPEAGAAYWYGSLRAPVEFEQAVRALTQGGYRMFAEVSPHPVLVPRSPGRRPAGAGDGDRYAAPRRRRRGPLPGLAGRGPRARHRGGLGGGAARGPPGGTPHVRVPPSAVLAGAARLADGRDGAEPETEARFWAAVEGGDVRTLADAMEADAPVPSLGEVLPVLASWRRRERERAVIQGWRYRVDWAPVATDRDRDEAGLAGRWLVLVPADLAGSDLAQACTQAMARSGAAVTVIEAAPDDTERAALTALVRRVTAGPDVAGVVSLLGLDETPVAGCAGVPRGLAGTVALLQALEAAATEAGCGC